MLHGKPFETCDLPLAFIANCDAKSHLSEDYFVPWIKHLLSLLGPGGVLVFTTRGRRFIDYLESLHKDTTNVSPALQGLVQTMRRKMSPPSILRAMLERGLFQFYPIGGGELASDFYGEAFIPKQYLKRNYLTLLASFDETVDYVDQSVAVLKSPLPILSEGMRW